MDSAILATLAVLILATAFTSSVVGKIAHWDETTDWFSELWPRLPRLVGPLGVIAAELGILVTLALWPKLGSPLAAAWLCAASAVLWRTRRRISSCACFGRQKPITMRTAARNVALGILSLVATALHNVTTTTADPAGLLAAGACLGAATLLLDEARTAQPEIEAQ